MARHFHCPPAGRSTPPPLALGRIAISAGAFGALQGTGEHPLRLLRRHAHHDYGDLHPFDIDANSRALRRGLRVLSSYHLPTGRVVWIITSGDRSRTAILTPEEYERRKG